MATRIASVSCHRGGADQASTGADGSATASQTTASRRVGGADSRANNKADACPTGAPRARVGFGDSVSLLVLPK